MKKIGLMMLSFLMGSTAALASTIGVSTHPFTMQKQVISTEFHNYSSGGTGKGLSARYLNNVSDRVNVDAGATITDGERANKIFAGADFLLIPDYGRQPRVSIKGLLETMSLDGSRINSFGAAPTLSKGFSFWGKEAFPFIALPVRVSLNEENNTYQTQTAMALGITGRIPAAGFENLVANLETNISIRNSYSAIILGISLPIQ